MKIQTDIIDQIKESTLRNYVIPGLDSSLLKAGKVRVFECSREHQEQITPHSHRFDILCIVLKGSVTNILWENNPDGDLYQVTNLEYGGAPGEYTEYPQGNKTLAPRKNKYKVGDTYSMSYRDIHSIQFSKGAVVLFLEGEDKTQVTQILEPMVNGNVIPTFKVEPYMFLKDK